MTSVIYNFNKKNSNSLFFVFLSFIYAYFNLRKFYYRLFLIIYTYIMNDFPAICNCISFGVYFFPNNVISVSILKKLINGQTNQN